MHEDSAAAKHEREFFNAEWLREIKALNLLAAERLQKLELTVRFDAFGNHGDA